MKTEVIHENNKFVKTVDGLDCELEYIIPEDGFINFFHTYVPEQLRGHRCGVRSRRKYGWPMQAVLQIGVFTKSPNSDGGHLDGGDQFDSKSERYLITRRLAPSHHRLCRNSKKRLNSACHAGLDPASSNVIV